MALGLDANALSALAEGDPTLERVIAGERALCLPVIVLGEYTFGIRQSRERVRYERWLGNRLHVFVMLNVDLETAREYAQIRSELNAVGRPIPTNDLWIAALARQHALPLVSRDRHFHSVPKLRVLTW